MTITDSGAYHGYPQLDGAASANTSFAREQKLLRYALNTRLTRRDEQPHASDTNGSLTNPEAGRNLSGET